MLAKYQYNNGGFGGMYYEFDYQGACLKSTEIAVKYILSLEKKPSADHPIIRKAMEYLLDNYLPGIGNWCEVVVPAVNDGVHCHWVRYRDEDVTPIEMPILLFLRLERQESLTVPASTGWNWKCNHICIDGTCRRCYG